MNKSPDSKDKIRFTDCDMFGHLNNSRYVDYLINAREDHLKKFYNFDFNEYYKNDLAWVIGSHEIMYLRAAVYNEIVTIKSTLLNLEVNSLHVETIMMDEPQNHIKAIMWSKLIPVNLKTGKKVPHDIQFMEWAKTIVNTEVNNNVDLKLRTKQLLMEKRLIKASNT